AVGDFLALRRVCMERGYADYIGFDPGIVRGFDYYTGFIFEIFDNSPDNNRALFGGGRYDRLIGLFGKEEVPAVGFGLGDVTLQNFIETHGLFGAGGDGRRGVYVTLFSEELLGATLAVAAELRERGVVVETALEP